MSAQIKRLRWLAFGCVAIVGPGCVLDLPEDDAVSEAPSPAGLAGTATGPTDMLQGANSGAMNPGPPAANPTPSAGAPGRMTLAPGTGMTPAPMTGANPPRAGAMAPAGGAAPPSCIDAVTNFDESGPFMFMKEMIGMVHVWVPMVPPGCKVPMVHYANGTNSTCDPNFEIMERLATHGFLGLCFESPNTGAGTEAMTAYETAMNEHGDMIDSKIGSMGHSTGGQGAFIAMQLAEEKFGLDDYKYAGLAVQPASGFGTQFSSGTWQSRYGMIKSPTFMFSGTADNLVSESWVRQAYDAMSPDTEVYWYSAVGATHVPAPNAWQLSVSVPWFRWKLLGEKAACEAFIALPDGDMFDTRESQNEAPCE